jgi:hypothetical protein
MSPKVANEDGDPLVGLRRELIRLRGGRGLAEPGRLLRLGSEFWNAVMPGQAKPVGQGEVIATAGRLIRQAIWQIADDLQRYARVEFNIDSTITGTELGDRQHALADELKFSVKTIRRRGDIAVHGIALNLFAIDGPDSAKARRIPGRDREMPEQTADELRRFWNISGKQRVDIVCSELPVADRPYYANPRDPNYLRYAKFSDLDSLVYLRTRLAETFPGCFVRDFSASEYFDSQADHLLVLGGPDWNSKMGEFQEHLPIKFFWNEEKQKTGVEMEDRHLYPEWSDGGSLICDYAMFARLEFRHGLTVSLICGCLAYGVLGASHCFLDPSVARSNLEFFGSVFGRSNFAVLMKIQDIGGIAQPPDLRTDCVAAYRSVSEFSFVFERIEI